MIESNKPTYRPTLLPAAAFQHEVRVKHG